MSDRPVIAILNTSPDVVELLALCFEHAGFATVSGFTYDIRDGHLDLEALLRQHRVDVVVYDIAPPYVRNWQLFERLRDTVLSAHPCVLTTTNTLVVKSLINPNVHVYEILEKPHTLKAIVDAVRAALPNSPHRQP